MVSGVASAEGYQRPSVLPVSPVVAAEVAFKGAEGSAAVAIPQRHSFRGICLAVERLLYTLVSEASLGRAQATGWRWN